MKQVLLPSGERVSAIGQGTWYMGEKANLRPAEIAALRLGLDLGATLIDTAEMYADGGAETVIGEALAGRRDEAFIVSKVYPHNASHRGAVAACERSLRRLRTDRIDLYLLHWRGGVAFSETMEAFVALKASGKIRHYGVSNLDLADMKELWSVPNGTAVETNQLLYNLSRRGIEWDLLPWLRERRIPVMAYSPIEQGRILRNPKLADFARRHRYSPAQVAIAWLLRTDDVIAIPKSKNVARVKENVSAADITLSREQLTELDTLFPPPKRSQSLEML